VGSELTRLRMNDLRDLELFVRVMEYLIDTECVADCGFFANEIAVGDEVISRTIGRGCILQTPR
jgi:hypothetical protein